MGTGPERPTVLHRSESSMPVNAVLQADVHGGTPKLPAHADSSGEMLRRTSYLHVCMSACCRRARDLAGLMQPK